MPRSASSQRDAAAIEALLRAAGFDAVEIKRDLGRDAMRRALRDFSDRVRDADIAVVFFAGHGIEVSGADYLIPVDAVLDRDIDVEDEAIRSIGSPRSSNLPNACGSSSSMPVATIPSLPA